jgi:D-glycero-alpha-D-manno-heptose-7-phosphate kinase
MPSDQPRPLRIVNSVAPIRIVDNGGWTDTWFARHGKIFNIGVYPYAEVQIDVFPASAESERIEVLAENYGERFTVTPGAAQRDHHPLLEAAIDYMRVPEEMAVKMAIYSEAPAGASTGTSAAVAVALIAALDRLTPGRMTPHQIAYAAHHVEMDILGLQCGIQDQLCSAFGGINYIEMHEFPRAIVSPIQVPNAVWWELERRLVLIYFGKSHSSSDVHRKVIQELENAGPECAKIDDLRKTAERSRDAVYAGDFGGLGRAMIENTEAQGRLHGDLVSADARRVIEVARECGAVGWKVNGAGGEGGSLTILAGTSSPGKREMIRMIEQLTPLYRNIPIYLSRFGVRTWDERVVG